MSALKRKSNVYTVTLAYPEWNSNTLHVRADSVEEAIAAARSKSAAGGGAGWERADNGDVFVDGIALGRHDHSAHAPDSKHLTVPREHDITTILPAAYLPAQPPEPPQVVVTVEGGVVRSVISDKPASVLILDFDTDGCVEEEIPLIPPADGEDSAARAFVQEQMAAVMPERVAQIDAAISAHQATVRAS